MFTRIVVPLDGSLLAESALPYALRLADVSGASLALIQAVLPLHVVWDYDLPYDAAAEAEELTRTGGALETVAARLRAASRVVDAYAVVGDPAEEILHYTARVHGDLIVMATHGRGGLAHWAFGSVARKVLTAADVPTLVVRPKGAPALPEEPATIGRLLVPLDGSKLAEAALPLARDVARGLDAGVTLVRAITLPTAAFVGGPEAPVFPPEYFTETVAAMHEGATAYLQPIADRLATEVVAADTAVLEGSPANALLDLLAGGAYDLVIMSTHGRTGVKRWVLGSVAERLVEAAHTPVLLFRSTGRHEAAAARGDSALRGGTARRPLPRRLRADRHQSDRSRGAGHQQPGPAPLPLRAPPSPRRPET